MITYETVLEAMQNAQHEGYGHAYMTINWNTEEITWGMCGSKAHFPENENTKSDTYTYISPMVSHWDTKQGNVPYNEAQIRQVASEWVFTLSQWLPPDVWKRIYQSKARAEN